MFGIKYFRPVLYMLIPLWVFTIIKAGFIYANSELIISEGLMSKGLCTFFKGFVILEIFNKTLAIVLLIRDISNSGKV